MQCKDRRERIGRTYDGEKRIYLVRRMYCRDCHRMHTELPDFLLKYKHYEAQIIEDGIEELIPAWRNYPVPETIHRWQIWFRYILPFLNAALDSVYTELENQLPAFFRKISYVDQLRKKGEGWLAAILDILINTNRYPERRIPAK